MREIKFRGLSDNEDGTQEMVYGDLIHDKKGQTAYFDTHPCRITWKLDKGGASKPIRKGTEGQYTGLKDKNGTEIFEGDICLVQIVTTNHPNHMSGEMTGVVKWYRNGWAIIPTKYAGKITKYFGENTIYGFLPHNISDKQNIEVIGNKFESPELLEKTETK